MNNKGQALVTFILVLPIILIIISLVIDYGVLSIDKRKISNNIKSSIEYGLTNIKDDNIAKDTEEIIYKNLDKKKIKNILINVNDNSILI